MFDFLNEVNERPEVFSVYTVQDLWNEEYVSKQMLKYHLNEDLDISSRNHKFIDKSADWIIKEFNINKKSSVVDFGCGPGFYTSRLAEAGADVTGIDFSENSIKYAKNYAEKNGLNINYVYQNYLEFETDKKFDLIIMIMCDFCVLSPAQRNKLLTKFNKLLKPGGKVLFDVYSMNFYKKKEESVLYEKNQLFGLWAEGDYYGFQNTFKYDDSRVTLDKYTIVEKDRVRKIYNWLQYFDPVMLEKEIEKAGLKLETLLGDVAGSFYNVESNEFAVVVSKFE